MMRTMISAAILSLALAGGALAQAPSPSGGAPAATATDKQTISKACSDQANEKGLRGKERKKFRSACKRKGGKQ